MINVFLSVLIIVKFLLSIYTMVNFVRQTILKSWVYVIIGIILMQRKWLWIKARKIYQLRIRWKQLYNFLSYAKVKSHFSRIRGFEFFWTCFNGCKIESKSAKSLLVCRFLQTEAHFFSINWCPIYNDRNSIIVVGTSVYASEPNENSHYAHRRNLYVTRFKVLNLLSYFWKLLIFKLKLNED